VVNASATGGSLSEQTGNPAVAVLTCRWGFTTGTGAEPGGDGHNPDRQPTVATGSDRGGPTVPRRPATGRYESGADCSLQVVELAVQFPPALALDDRRVQ
jgi:hypothetical protein